MHHIRLKLRFPTDDVRNTSGFSLHLTHRPFVKLKPASHTHSKAKAVNDDIKIQYTPDFFQKQKTFIQLVLCKTIAVMTPVP